MNDAESKSEKIESHETSTKNVEENTPDKLERLLSSLHQGWKIVIIRELPTIFRGHLETIEYYGDEDEPIDVDYLLKKWGGRKLIIKVHDKFGRWVGGATVPLFSYPPKVNGQELDERQAYGGYRADVPSAAIIPSPHGAIVQPQPQPQFDIGRIIDMMGRQKGTNVADILKLVEFVQARNQQQYQQPDMIQQMLGTLEMFKRMKTVFSDMGETNSDDSGFTSLASEMLRGLMSSRNKQQEPKRRSIAPPRMNQQTIDYNNSQLSSKVDNDSQNTSKLSNPVNRMSLTQLASQLSSLSPEDAATAAALALDGMDNEKQRAVMSAIIDGFSGDDDIDDSEEIPDNYSNGDKK